MGLVELQPNQVVRVNDRATPADGPALAQVSAPAAAVNGSR